MIFIYKINALPNPTPNSASNGEVHGAHSKLYLRTRRISELELQIGRVWARGSTFLCVTADKPMDILILKSPMRKTDSYAKKIWDQTGSAGPREIDGFGPNLTYRASV